MEMTIYQQNFMRAVRQQMGWPAFCPANDCIGFGSGKEVDFAVGSEIARIAQVMRKDIVYTGWARSRAKDPTSFTIAYREILTVDIVDRLVPFAASDEAPVVLISTRADEVFAVDRRGSLVRMFGKPKVTGRGRKLAMKRIREAAAMMGDDLIQNNCLIPSGGDWIEPNTALETIVQFR